MKTYAALLGGLIAAVITPPTQAQQPDNGAARLRLPTAIPVAQPLPDNGVYLTAEAFNRGVLTDAFANSTPGEHIWTTGPGGAVCVGTPGETDKFPDKRTWGYRKNGQDYRIVDGDAYAIVSEKDILMYRIVDPRPDSYAYWNPFFFSRFPDSDLLPISKQNLEMVYSDHPAFVHKLKTDQSLLSKNDQELIPGVVALYLFRQASAPEIEQSVSAVSHVMTE